MHDSSRERRNLAISIWRAGVDAVSPAVLVPRALGDPSLGISESLAGASRIIVVGAGKAGAAMTAALAESLAGSRKEIVGLVNVPNETVRKLPVNIELHGARPAASNQPTEAGVAGSRRILEIASSAGPNDVCICLLSGGGSALLPAPCPGITLEQKQRVTLLLHACGASIGEMNAVRKHLSAIKGGRLAEAFKGAALFSLILSDVIGDSLDVIASGPTVADPTTFADALAILRKYSLLEASPDDPNSRVPAAVVQYLEDGAAGIHPETPKRTPGHVRNLVIGNNQLALESAARKAVELGFQVHSLGSSIDGDTTAAAANHAKVVTELLDKQTADDRPICLLGGGETTVNLGTGHGKGGRNQEFALSLLLRLPVRFFSRYTILAGGTDGEDGPTDAAGAIVDAETWEKILELNLIPTRAVRQHDTYPVLDLVGSLLRTGLTQTNVMDLRVILLFEEDRPIFSPAALEMLQEKTMD
jgi:hydroxypyruvate reductase/glycerate 2-kinase